MTLKEYVEYSIFGRDDSPLYMFESAIEGHPEAKAMVDEYSPVKFCQQDYFVELVSIKERPNHCFSLEKTELRHIDGS